MIDLLTVNQNSLVMNYRIERIGWQYSLSKHVQLEIGGSPGCDCTTIHSLTVV